MMMRRLKSIACAFAASAVVFAANPLAAQTEPPPAAAEDQAQSEQSVPEPQPETPPAPPQTPVDQTNPSLPPPTTTDVPPSVLSGAAGASYDRRESLPNVNIYLPEGQASVRIRKLIRNVLFESQIEYKFIEGDISTFLRYKYYARNFTYKLGIFDTIQFPDPGEDDRQPFERVRGGLLLFEFPRDYNNRYYWLVQDDRLTFGTTENVDDRKNNVYTKVSYQYGTQFDERMNAIVGESRGRITPVLTAFRELGPQKLSFAAAVTGSGKVGTGDYQYLKLESELLKRFDVSPTTFFVSRAHAGLFPVRKRICVNGPNNECLSPTTEQPLNPNEQYSIPRYELFAMGGREALRSVRDNASSEGTHEFHLTNEYFFPIFRNRDYRTFILHWNTMYGIAYLGAGAVGLNYRDLPKSANRVIDAGIGTEMSVTVRDFDVLFSVLYARGLSAPVCADPPPVGCRDLKNDRILFSIRTVR